MRKKGIFYRNKVLRTSLCVKKLKLYFLKSKNSDRLNESVNEEVGNCSIRMKEQYFHYIV